MSEKIMQNAKVISDILKRTNIQERGELLKQVADNLKDRGQGFTGKLFEQIAKEYGY